MAVLLATLVTACSPDAPVADAETGTGTDDPGSSTAATSETSDTAQTETGAPEPACGDGVLDPGEDCDDGNLAAGDGCSPSCTIGPCGFEWTARELVLTGSSFEVSTPMVVDGDSLLVAHQLGQNAEQVGLLRAAAADGAPVTSEVLELGDDDPVPHALALGPDGAAFVASADVLAKTSSVRRIEPDGATLTWVDTRASVGPIVDLRLDPDGALILLTTVDDGPMNQDVELAALDPATGEQLWAHQFGGPPAANGFSTDRAAALDVDGEGRTFVAYDEYRAWDTVAPVVLAFGPGGAAEPLWTTPVLELPGRVLRISDLDVGPDGTVALSFMRWDGTQIFWIAALDGESGELAWVVERDDFELPNIQSTIRGVAVLDERVLALGSWIAALDGVDVRQGYVLGLDLDGALVCVATSDDYEPATGATSETHLPLALVPIPGAGAFASGYVNDFGSSRVDLWLARIR